jgi:hypothetical protein
MESIWPSIAFAAAIFVVFTGVSAWWHQRRNVADLKRDLAWSEQSRFLAEQRAADADAQLEAMASLRRVTPIKREFNEHGERLDSLDSTLRRIQRHASPSWDDTEPMARPDTALSPTCLAELRPPRYSASR